MKRGCPTPSLNGWFAGCRRSGSRSSERFDVRDETRRAAVSDMINARPLKFKANPHAAKRAMSARMRFSSAGSVGSMGSSLPSSGRNGRYQSPGFAPIALTRRANSSISIPHFSFTPAQRMSAVVLADPCLPRCQPSSTTIYGRTFSSLTSETMNSASARKFVAVLLP